MQSLVLNNSCIPVSIVPARRAVSLVMSQKAMALASYPGLFCNSVSITMPLPSVIQTIRSNYMPKKFVSVLPFNRQNVYVRDHGCCMYCGKKVSLANLTFDHVVPRCEGGKSCWDNVVIACSRCNSLKGRRSVDKFRRLIRKPYAPRLDKAAPAYLVNKLMAEIPHETWTDHIYWSVILEP